MFFQYFTSLTPIDINSTGIDIVQPNIHDTTITSIHYPNKVIRGFGNIVDYGFLVSFSGRSSLDAIQKSLDNQGDYDIIFENNKFFLTQNNIQKLLDYDYLLI